MAIKLTNLDTDSLTIYYDNTKTGINCDNVSCALDVLYDIYK